MVYIQRWHGWCHMKLLPSRRVLCTPYNHAPCHFMQSHIRKMHAYLAVTCHLHIWQNDRVFLSATAGTRGWNAYRNESAQKVDPGEENSAVIRTHDLLITRPALQPLSYPRVVCGRGTDRDRDPRRWGEEGGIKPVLNWANICSRT